MYIIFIVVIYPNWHIGMPVLNQIKSGWLIWSDEKHDQEQDETNKNVTYVCI